MEQSTSPRTSNLQRAEWRTKCRVMLAEHLRVKLGIEIDPSQVRLQPASEDGYTWKALPEKTNLFTKQLSKHSLGVYMELCREIGVSFEAVPNGIPLRASDPNLNSSISFSSRIDQLLLEKDQLLQEVGKLREALGVESEKRERAENALEQTKSELHAADTQIQGLSRQNKELVSKESFFRRRSEQYARGIHEAFSALHKCKVDTLDLPEDARMELDSTG